MGTLSERISSDYFLPQNTAFASLLQLRIMNKKLGSGSKQIQSVFLLYKEGPLSRVKDPCI